MNTYILAAILVSTFFLIIHADNEPGSGCLLDNFDGPYNHDVLLGGLADMPCATSVVTKKLLFQYFTSPAKHLYQLKWVHRRWDRLVDPWNGDGRRTYKTSKILQSLLEIGEMRRQEIPRVSGISLQVLSISPQDNGLYACLLSKGIFAQGLRMDLANATLLSVHLLHVMEVKVFDQSKSAAGGENSKGTFFDAWTWQIYKFNNAKPDDLIYEADCYADILLTGLALRGFDSSFIRVGWKFTPRGRTPAGNSDSEDEEILTPWNFISPVRICWQKEDCQRNEEIEDEEFEEENKDEEMEKNTHKNLEQIYHTVTRKLWKSRGLHVVAGNSFGSGTWQCWLEGVDMLSTTPKIKSDIELKHMQRWLVSETRVFILDHSVFGWWNTVEVWRVAATWTAPTCYLLFYLLVGIAWGAAARWSHLLYASDASTTILAGGADTIPGPYEFEPEKYTHEFLNRHGIMLIEEDDNNDEGKTGRASVQIGTYYPE